MKPAEIPSYYRERGITSSGLNVGPPLKAFTFVNVFTTSRAPELFMAAKRTQWRTRNRGRQDETRARVRMGRRGGRADRVVVEERVTFSSFQTDVKRGTPLITSVILYYDCGTPR